MMQRILSALGYAVLDLDAVANAMASRVLQDFDPVTLDPTSCVQYFRTKYMRWVAEYGMPADACNDVADRAWRVVAKARDVPINVPQMVELYD